MIDKNKWYQAFKPFAKNKHTSIRIFFDFDSDNGKYCLVYDWSSKTAWGAFNPKMYAQLYDRCVSGSRKYITPDLVWDCREENTTTDYRLYKFLDAWAAKAIKAYEAAR